MTAVLFDTCATFIRTLTGVKPSSDAIMEQDVVAATDSLKKGLFAQCTFAIVQSAAFSERDAASMAAELRLHDGEVLDNPCPCNINLAGITHVIATTYDFPEYNTCVDALIPVVKPTWVQHSLARDRLANPRQYSPDPRYFMSNVVACVADLPQGDADAIAGGILAMGGLFSTKLTNQVTHIIALTMDSECCTIAQKRKLNLKIVLPHWVDDCLKLGRLIDELPYQLQNPEILKVPANKPPLGKRKNPVEGAVNPDPSQEDHVPQPPRKLAKVFKTKAVLLADDLGISPYLRRILSEIITTGDGKIATSVSKADMYICKYREGKDYKLASRAGKDVGNLAWLYFLIQTDDWTSPLRRLLHYPVSRTGLAGFSGLRISLSNYSGDARAYLENLINATGAECTKTLKQDNTHLITAHDTSEKCAAAKDWGIHIINHLWLEESYARWKMQSITDSRYTHFPQRTNLSDVVGQTQLDRSILEQIFYPEDPSEKPKAEKKPMRQVNQNIIEANPTSLKHTAPEQVSTVSQTGQVTPARTPASKKIVALGKENITPATGSSRKSKEVAASRLHENAQDILLYNKESKRKGGVVYGGRRKTDEDRVAIGRKRSMDEVEADDDMSSDNEAKKIKRSNPLPTMHLAVSGYKKWVGNPKVEDQDKKKLRALGILVIPDAKRASHLAAPNIVRTQKFVTAIAYASMIISTDFIDACLKKDELCDPQEYTLKDAENEKKLGISLKKSRERAEKNRNQLLQGRCIYCVENIPGGYETFKSIVEANGGRCMMWRNRKGTTVPSGRADSEVSTDTDTNNDVYLLSDKNTANKTLWARFREMAEGSRKVPRIVVTDWLLETAMSQQVLATKDYEV